MCSYFYKRTPKMATVSFIRKVYSNCATVATGICHIGTGVLIGNITPDNADGTALNIIYLIILLAYLL